MPCRHMQRHGWDWLPLISLMMNGDNQRLLYHFVLLPHIAIWTESGGRRDAHATSCLLTCVFFLFFLRLMGHAICNVVVAAVVAALI